MQASKSIVPIKPAKNILNRPSHSESLQPFTPNAPFRPGICRQVFRPFKKEKDFLPISGPRQLRPFKKEKDCRQTSQPKGLRVNVLNAPVIPSSSKLSKVAANKSQTAVKPPQPVFVVQDLPVPRSITPTAMAMPMPRPVFQTSASPRATIPRVSDLATSQPRAGPAHIINPINAQASLAQIKSQAVPSLQVPPLTSTRVPLPKPMSQPTGSRIVVVKPRPMSVPVTVSAVETKQSSVVTTTSSLPNNSPSTTVLPVVAVTLPQPVASAPQSPSVTMEKPIVMSKVKSPTKTTEKTQQPKKRRYSRKKGKKAAEIMEDDASVASPAPSVVGSDFEILSPVSTPRKSPKPKKSFITPKKPGPKSKTMTPEMRMKSLKEDEVTLPSKFEVQLIMKSRSEPFSINKLDDLEDPCSFADPQFETLNNVYQNSSLKQIKENLALQLPTDISHAAKSPRVNLQRSGNFNGRTIFI